MCGCLIVDPFIHACAPPSLCCWHPPRPLLLVGVLLLNLELDDEDYDYGMLNMSLLPDALLTSYAGQNPGGRLVAE
jgi:hypothetical protein